MNENHAREALREIKNALNVEDGARDADWRRSVCAAFDRLAASLGIVQLDHAEGGPMDFVAKILHEHDCAARGVTPTRWWRLSGELKEKFRQQAINTVASWATEEAEHRALADRDAVRLVPRRSS